MRSIAFCGSHANAFSSPELRVLNERYEQIAVHKRRYGREMEPIINFENYIGALSRKPRAFVDSPYFPTLPKPVQDHLRACTYPDLKKMLLTLVPIIRDGKITEASTVLELATGSNSIFAEIGCIQRADRG